MKTQGNSNSPPTGSVLPSLSKYISDHIEDYILRRAVDLQYKNRALGAKNPIPFLTHFSLDFAIYEGKDFSAGMLKAEAQNIFNNKYLKHNIKLWKDQGLVENFMNSVKFLIKKVKRRNYFLLHDIIGAIYDKNLYLYPGILTPLYNLVVYLVPKTLIALPTIALWKIFVPLLVAKALHDMYNYSVNKLSHSQKRSEAKYSTNLQIEKNLILEKNQKKNNEIEIQIEKLIVEIGKEKNTIFNLKEMMKEKSQILTLDPEAREDAEKVKDLITKLTRDINLESKRSKEKSKTSEISKAFVGRLDLIVSSDANIGKSKFKAYRKDIMSSEKAKEFLKSFRANLEEACKLAQQNVSPVVIEVAKEDLKNIQAKGTRKKRTKSPKNDRTNQTDPAVV